MWSQIRQKLINFLKLFKHLSKLHSKLNTSYIDIFSFKFIGEETKKLQGQKNID